jgi:hypothetical protein
MVRRSCDTEVRYLASLAETLRRVGQPQDGADLVAQEQNRDEQQERRGADHPEQEDLRVRGISRAAASEHPHHRVIELDANLDERRAPDRIDPEWPPDLLAQLDRERLVEQGEERFWSGRRHFGGRQEIDHEPEPVARDAPDLPAIRILRIGLVDVHQRRDVLHHGGGEALGDRIPMPLHEHEGDHRLQDHHRGDDDQQRTGIEALRQNVIEPAPDPVPHTEHAPGRRAQRCHADIEAGHGVTTSR